MENERSHLRTMVNEDGAAILDTRLGEISTLNSTAAYIWLALERGQSVCNIAESLARETGHPVHVIERDVRGFIETLKERRLLSC